MAVEIKELIIRAVAEDGEKNGSVPNSGMELSTEQADAIIRACVQEVLKILERKNAK